MLHLICREFLSSFFSIVLTDTLELTKLLMIHRDFIFVSVNIFNPASQRLWTEVTAE